ncbi:MAG: hypothetical protein IH895_01105 [Planctomycetes bacterium]|nr:hypothetical protein [Planctomycetota bacterium]
MSDSGQHARSEELLAFEQASAAPAPPQRVRRHFPALPLVMLVYLACSIWGLGWGLHSPERDRYLFPADSQWNRTRVAELRAAQPDDLKVRGADVDPDPVEIGDMPVILNESDERIAEIYSRYLLFSSQPDEMITFRAMREMDPANLKLDPRLYQYGGLFIYPLGGLIKLASMTGWAQISGLSDFLNEPAQFAKFYVIGRAYVVLWGLLGVWIVYAIGWRLGDWRSGATAALLFALLPAVVALSHESKPHLPGAVLMLWAVLWALKYVETGGVRHRFMLALSCGLALGMVLSSLWIFVLIPLAEFLTRASTSERLARTFAFGAIGALTYCVTNPYVIINVFVDRDVLRSNLGNSTAMYHWSDFGAGLANAFALLTQGSSLFVIVAGLLMLVALWGWDWRRTLLLVVPAAVFFVQFAGLAAGKPGEYGRFTIFPSAILCILLSAGLFRFLASKWYQGTLYSLAAATALAWPTLSYLESLHHAETDADTRYQLAAQLTHQGAAGFPSARVDSTAIAVLREPAPYNFPPVDFTSTPIVHLPKIIASWPRDRAGWPDRLIVPLNGTEGVDVDAILADGYYALPPGERLPEERSPITWANKPLIMLVHAKQQ